MAEIMDPYAYELLTNPLPPGFAELLFSGDASTATEETTTEQMDGYLRAIGVLPPLPLPLPPTTTQPGGPGGGQQQMMDDGDDPQQQAAAAGDALVLWMRDFARHFGLGHATLRRALSYADRFLSARDLVAGADADYQLRLLGAAAVRAAAEYEGRRTVRRMEARDIAGHCGFAASKDVIAMERALLAALGYQYHLGGPASIAGADYSLMLLDHLLPKAEQ